MSIWHLILREVAHRKRNFVLGVLAMACGAACLVGAQTLIHADRLATETILGEKEQSVAEAVAAKEAAVAQAGADLEDTIRKQMVGLGFNILILPEDQELSELHLNGTLSATMPEEYVDKLANSSIVTVNHLLPAVTRRVVWPEKETEVILYGTRGEVPIMHRALKKPILDAVAPGQMVLGHSIHTRFGLKAGDSLLFMGREFTVSKTHPQRGSTDDVTVWIDLAQAQELLEMQNLVHGILALECECAGDRISGIRNEIASILPGTQVIERYSQALARAEARAKAKQVAEDSLAQEKESGTQLLEQERTGRAQIEQQHALLASVLVPLVLLASAGLVGALAYTNARHRREEIGILRALGVRSSQIIVMFLAKAAALGLIGGLLGCAVGFWAGSQTGDAGVASLTAQSDLFITLLTTPLFAVALAAVASWIPALLAARQDAALVLSGRVIGAAGT